MKNYHAPKVKVSYERARELFSYNSETGAIVRICDAGRGKRGDTFEPRACGYVIISVDGHEVLGHHLAWLLHFRVYPAHMIDHADGDKSNNRIDNLRFTNTSHNGMNRQCRKKKFRGVTQLSTNVFAAYAGGRNFEMIGRFPNELAAAIARDDAVIARFGRGAVPLNFECEVERAKVEMSVYFLRVLVEIPDMSKVNALCDAGILKTPSIAIPTFKAMLEESVC